VEPVEMRNDSSLLPSAGGDLSCKVWAPFWAAVLFENMGNILVGLIYPDLAVKSLNHGLDPCAGEGAGSTTCQRSIEWSSATYGVYSLVGGILAMFAVPLLGTAADHFGRRPMLIVAIVASKLPLAALLSATFAGTSITYFFAASIAPTVIPISMLYWLWIHDMTTPSDRSQMYGRLSAASNIEGVVIPLATVIAKGKNAVLLLAAVRVSVLLVVIFGVRESRAPELLGGSARDVVTEGKATFLRRWKNVGKLCADPPLRNLIVAGMLCTLTTYGITSVSLLYCKEKFGATMETYAPLMAVSTCSNGLVQLFLLKPLENKVGLRGIFLLSVAAGVCLYVANCFAQTLQQMMFLSFLSGLGNIGTPAFQTALSNVSGTIPGLTPAMALGSLQALSLLMAVLGTPFFNTMLSASLRMPIQGIAHPEVIFIAAAALNVIALIIVWRLPRDFFLRGL